MSNQDDLEQEYDNKEPTSEIELEDIEIITPELEPDEIPVSEAEAAQDEENTEIVLPEIKDTAIYELDVTIEQDDKYRINSYNGIAEIIKRGNYFAQDAGGMLHVYRNGSYHADAEKSIRLAVKQILETKGKDYTKFKGAEVVSYIGLDAPLLLDRPDPCLLNVANGLVYFYPDGSFMSFEEHDPKYRTTVQLPVIYNPEAKCPYWDKLIADIFPEDAQELAWEIIAWAMLPLTNIKRSILLKGEGNDGKSIFLGALSDFIGPQNVSHISLHDLDRNFQAVGLLGKLINIDTDLSSRDLADSATIKRITGGDRIRVERKYHGSFDIIPFARCLFSCNILPKSTDRSRALQDRFLVIPFTSKTEDPKYKRFITNALKEPDELSGVLNKALTKVEGVMDIGFSVTPKFAAQSKAILQSAGTLGPWINSNTELGPDKQVRCSDLHNAYMRAEPKDWENTSSIRFGSNLRELVPTIERRQITNDGFRSTYYLGISLIEGTVESDDWQ